MGSSVDLKYPGMRDELMRALELLSEPYTPDPEYRAKGPAGGSLFLDIFELLYNELDLSRHPERGVGYYLRDDAEARELAALTPLLRAVLEEAPASATDDEYQATPSWPKLVAAARAVRESLN